MAWKQLCAGTIFAIGMAQPAFAAAIVAVEVFVEGGDRYDATTEDDPAFNGAPIASGLAYGDIASGFANLYAGPLPCAVPCSITGVGGGSGLTSAEANGFAGSLRARARSSAESSTLQKHASATAKLTDTISFNGAPVVNFDIDLSSMVIGEASSSLLFNFGLDVVACGPEGCSGPPVLAQLLVSESRHTGEGEHRFYQLTIDNQVVATGDVILDSYEFSYDFSPFLNSPPGFPFPIPDSFDIFAELFVGTSAGKVSDDVPDLGGTSFAQMLADQSVFIQIDDVVSANGYNYPGQLLAPPPGEVPEPTSLALLAIGLIGLGWGQLRRVSR